MISRIVLSARRAFCKISAYDIEKGTIVFLNGRYVEIMKAAPSTNRKLRNLYKVETIDLFTNQMEKEYYTYGQIESFDKVEYSTLPVEYQYYDEDRNLLIFSDDCYNQHEVPSYLYRGHAPTIQSGSKFVLLMDGERYIKLI